MGGRSRSRAGLGIVIAAGLATAAVVTISPFQSVVAAPPDANGVWIVDSALDTTDAALGNGTCDDGAGNCTLRAAVAEAEAQMAGGADASIAFAPQLAAATVSIGLSLNVTVPLGRTLIVDGVGGGAQRPVLDGGDSDRIFTVIGAGRFSLINLELANGNDLSGEGGGAIHTTIETGLFSVTVRDSAGGSWEGGGVRSEGLLSIYDSEFYGNQARSGAAVWSNAWTRVLRSSFHNNAAAFGGALYVESVLDLSDSVVRDNQATQGGGGVYCSCSRADVIRTALIGNRTLSTSGGGIYAEAAPGGPPFDVTLADVSLFQNSSDTDGSALFVEDQGNSTLDNVTIVDNDSALGTALRLSGTGFGATNAIRNTIMWGNERAVLGPVFDDCGTFDYDTGGTNSIVGAGGCNPLGGGSRINVDPQIVGEGQFGGGVTVGPFYGEPTVVAIDGGSPALDAGICQPGDRDARFLPRPTPNCDLGAFELTLTAGAFRDDGDGTFGNDTSTLDFGSVRVPLDRLPGSVLTDPSGNGALDSPGTVSQAQIRGIDLVQTGFAAVPLRQVALDAIPLDVEVLASITLDQIPLDYSSANGTGWQGYLLDFVPALATQPLNTVGFGRVLAATAGNTAADLDVGQIDFSATPLGSLPVGAIALGRTPLAEIATDGDEEPIDWCVLIDPYTDRSCGPGAQIDPSTATLVSISLQGVPLRQVPLRQVPLRQVDLDAAPLRQVPLRQVDIEASPLRQVPLRQVTLQGAPLRQVPLRQVDVLGSPLRQVPLRQVTLQGSPLRQVPLRQVNIEGSPLRQVRLVDITNVASIVDCSMVACADPSLVLGDVPVAHVIGTLGLLADNFGGELGGLGEIGGPDHPDAYGAPGTVLFTLGMLVDSTTGELGTLGEIGGPGFPDAYGDLTIGDFLLALLAALPDVTLGDLLAGVLPESEMPWGDLDLGEGATAFKQAVAPAGTQDTSIKYDVTIDSTLPSGTPIEVDLSVPDGYTLLPGSFELRPPVANPGTDIVTPPLASLVPTIGPEDRPGRTLASMTITPQLDPTTAQVRLVFRAVPPIELGQQGPFEIQVNAPDWGVVDVAESAGVIVDDILESNDVIGDATPFVEYDNDSLPPVPLNDVDDVLFLTHLDEFNDVDWFELPVEQGDRLSVFLSNLPADYDVQLFGPAQAPLRGTPTRSVPPSPDGGLSLLGDDNAVNADIGGDIDTTAPSPDLELYGVSSRRGTTSERIDTSALPAGTYYIKVTGYNGASSGSPYSLRARTTPTAGGGACAAIPPAAPATLTLPAAVRTVTAQTTTILLTHVGRLQRSYDGTAHIAVDALVDFVNEVNAAPTQFADTSAAVVTLDDLSAFVAWDQDPCDPDLANDVVSQVGARIDSIRAGFPNVQNIVLVGADDQIPFARMKDAVPAHNESEYASTFDDSSPLSAALSLGYVLSDNPYGSARPLAVGPRELFVPEVGVGRLVETPADIATALGNFTDFNGELDPQTALSTGYDFLTDGADAVADELTAPGGRFGDAAVDRLNDDEWTRDDLRQVWLGSSAPEAADVVSVNAHFDHYRALPADQDSAGLLTDPFGFDDVTGSVDGSLAGAIVFSMGCHMGLSVSDISVAGTLNEDWAQVLSSEGAIVAGNTGYGYGDDTVVGATEELMRQFARRLDGSMTVGEAMAFAKQQYTADLLVVSPFDEKVVSQVVFYGLPMYRLADGEPAQPPVNPPVVTDPVTGLQAMPVTVTTPVDVAGGLQSTNPVGGNGEYYAINGQIQATPYQPVQPRTTTDVTQAGKEARGALLTGLTSIDRGMSNPAIMTPTDDVTGANPEARVDGAFFPSALQSIGRRADVSGPRDQLVIVPGQFRDDPSTSSGGGVQRLFTQSSATVYYAPDGNTDVVAPVITSTSAVIVGSSAAFTVSAADNAGISRVNVLYSTPPTNPSSPRNWSSVDLALAGSVYSGAGLVSPGATEVDYFVQVVDTGGNVAVGSNKGVNYTDAPLVSPPDPISRPPSISLPPTGTPGQYTGDVQVTVTDHPTVGGPVNTRIDGGAPTSAASITVSTPGLHTVVSTGPDGSSATATFFIGTVVTPPTPPTATAQTASAAPPSGWFTSIPSVVITGVAGTSAVAKIKYRIGSAPFTIVNASSATVPVNVQGTSTVEYAAIDANGLEGAVGSLQVRFDSLAPQITLTTPAAGATYTIGQVVNAAYSCADAAGASGLAAVNGCTGTKAPGQAIDTATAGTKSFTVTTKDVAGNTTSTTRTYTVVPSFVPMSGSTFTTQPGGVLKFTSSASKPLGSFAWLSGPGGRTGTVSGPLTFTTTGTASGRGFGVMVGTYQTSGVVLTGLSVQFDPGYDCGTKSAGSKIGSLVIQRWVAVPITAAPEACTAAPVDLYPGSNNTQKTNAAKADRNAKYWSKPMTIQVMMQPGNLPGTTRITGSATSAGPNGQPRTITVSTTVLTVTLGPSWGLRAFGDTAGTFTPTVSVS